MNDDIISRQAAIDAMAELQGRASTKAELKGISKAWKRIKKLKPIEPKIILCKDCKYYDPIYTGGAGVCGHWNAKTETNVYCAYADRKTE